MFREIKSITFEIQTVGRILRMPELKHYQNESLNRAYVYTDLPKQAYQIEKTAKDFIKNSLGYRDVNLYNMFALPSFFNSRIDYQDV
jgi:type III restriction enzyme